MIHKHSENFGDSRYPLYIQLAADLKQALASGQWAAGDRIPSESELARTYDVAPGTARQAVSYLVNAGLLERKQGLGTFVTCPSFQRSLLRFFSFRRANGEDVLPESRILKSVLSAAPEEVAQALNLSVGAPAIQLSRLRLLEGTPVMAEDIWLDATKFKDFNDYTDADIGPLLYPFYQERYGHFVAKVSESLHIAEASAAYARLLKIPTGKSIVVIDRVARGIESEPIEWRRSRGRADDFVYHIDIEK